ncbi:secretory subunit [Ceratocystis pirilliformis]|uniref:Secretory subunit n=1 Tax=Ceratocystis pirilliformis TaxID=259994 RepID=A0ABR3ZKL0_9PEZI
MSSEYSYDEDLQFFPFFAGAAAAIVAIPLTINLFSSSQDISATTPHIVTDFKAEHHDMIQGLRVLQKRKKRKVKTALVAILAWAAVAVSVYLISTRKVQDDVELYNPYDILGLVESATEKQIKSKYRKLSLRFHPDKIRPDLAKNETIESLSAHYVELTKAYQALTNEEIRNNWLQYGHPDGKSLDFSFGIALPKWVVSEGNGKYVVLAYALLLGVLLPYYVGRWWYGTQRMSKEGVLLESANNLFRQYTDDIDEGGIITILSSGAEYKEMIRKDKADNGLAKIEARISSLLTTKNREKLEEMDDLVRRKSLALLWAYIHRVDLEDAALNKAKFEVAPVARSLVQAFTGMTLAYSFTNPILASFHTAQNIVQAIPPKASALLQLPFFSNKTVEAIDGDSKTHVSLRQFMSLPNSHRKHLAVTKGGLTNDEYKTAIVVAKQFPDFQVEKAFFKVTGERFVTPSSLVSLVVKGRVIPPGCENIPKVDESELEDLDPAEDDLDALTGRKKKAIKDSNGKVISVKEENILPTLTYAPRFAREFTPSWYIFLTDSKQGKMAVPPFKFSSLDQPIVGADGKPTFNVQTMKAVFAAPPSPGDYTFVMHLVCDSYVGLDTKMEVTLHVEDGSKAAQIEAEDEISEPEEDSIAGAMHMLKTGKMPSVPAESDDESGTDDDVDDDTSDTNTDTEDEGNL